MKLKPSLIKQSPETWSIPGWFSNEVVPVIYNWGPRLTPGVMLTADDITVTLSAGLTNEGFSVEDNVSTLYVGGGNKLCIIDMLALSATPAKVGVRLQATVLQR